MLNVNYLFHCLTQEVIKETAKYKQLDVAGSKGFKGTIRAGLGQLLHLCLNKPRENTFDTRRS